MARRAQVPDELRHGPFHVRVASALGVTSDRLRGSAYRRLLPRVWVWDGYEMCPSDWHRAARLSAPEDARFTGVSQLQRLGLDLGPTLPVQMVVARDLHRDHPDLRIHRTDRLPTHDDEAVSGEGAFIELCRWLPLVDVAAAGDWLLRKRHMDLAALRSACAAEPWREGTHEARWVSPFLDPSSRSVQESRVRTWFSAAGLPESEVNAPLEVDGQVVAHLDWLWRRLRVGVEYEGGHHQTDRGQYLADISRYRLFRDIGLDYLQITHEAWRSPRSVVRSVHRRLAAAGYDGPPPVTDHRLDAVRLPIGRARSVLAGGPFHRALTTTER